MISGVRQNYRVLLPGLLLGVVSLLVLSLLGDFHSIGGLFASYKWAFFALAIALNFLHHILRFLNLSFSLNITGIKHVPFGKRLTFYLSSAALNATDQYVNVSYRSIWLSKVCEFPLNRVDSIFLIDEVSVSMSVFVLAILGILAAPVLWPYFVAMVGVFALMVLFLRIQPTENKLVEAKRTRPILQLLSQNYRDKAPGKEKINQSGPLVVSLLLNVLSWITQMVALYFILIGLGLPPDLGVAAIACLVLGFAIMIGSLSNLPGGLGVVELVLAGLLSILLGYQPEFAVVATILFRLSTFWISLLFGILFWPAAAKSCMVDTGAAPIA